MRKTALLAGAAAALLMAAPAALAQDMPQQSDPSAQSTAPQASEAQAGLSLSPGQTVKGSDGAVFGTLEGVQNTDDGGQELTVRGSDGELYGVPTLGIRAEGSEVVVGWSSTEFAAADPIPGAPPAPTADQSAAPVSGETATPAPAPADASPMTPPAPETLAPPVDQPVDESSEPAEAEPEGEPQI